MAEEARPLEALQPAVTFASEFVVPGGANLVKGDFKTGGIHALLGVLARMQFGMPGLIAVSANSVTKAITGRHIPEILGLVDWEKKPAAVTQHPAHPTKA